MGPELEFMPTGLGMGVESYHHPIFQANAVPFAHDFHPRPHKRPRLAAESLPSIDTTRVIEVDEDVLRSAWSTNGANPAHVSAQQPAEASQSTRSSSMPPPNKPGRKKKTKLRPNDDPFIQESFAFPEQQTWLKVKSRQRKPVEVEEIAQAPPPASQAPPQGEALLLDRHADRIAALIAQKRKDNESKLFRERMSLQQRLHRGEADDKSKLIAASHDELKRKMELSAQGIHEERPPNGREPVFALPDVSCVSSPLESNDGIPSLESTHNTPPPRPGRSLSLQLDRITVPDGAGCEADLLNVDDEVPHYDGSEVQSPVVGAGSMPLVHGPHLPGATYYQTQTTVTTQTFAYTNAPVQPQSTQYFFTQPRFTNQRTSNPTFWEQPPGMSDVWTSQVYNALPSTSTPILGPSNMATVERRFSVHAPPSQATGSSEPTSSYAQEKSPTESYAAKTLLDRITNSNQNTSHFDPSPPVLRSNVNMFTKQARENGVIGGNNNYTEPPAEGRRRNMFDNRT